MFSFIVSPFIIPIDFLTQLFQLLQPDVVASILLCHEQAKCCQGLAQLCGPEKDAIEQSDQQNRHCDNNSFGSLYFYISFWALR